MKLAVNWIVSMMLLHFEFDYFILKYDSSYKGFNFFSDAHNPQISTIFPYFDKDFPPEIPDCIKWKEYFLKWKNVSQWGAKKNVFVY